MTSRPSLSQSLPTGGGERLGSPSGSLIIAVPTFDWWRQIFAARLTIQEAQPTATKNTTAVQACGSGSLFVRIANATVTAAIPHKKAIAMQHR